MSRKATEFQKKEMSRMYRGKQIFKPLNTGWTDDFAFAFAHKDKLCSPFKSACLIPRRPTTAMTSRMTPRNGRGRSGWKARPPQSGIEEAPEKQIQTKIALHYPAEEREAIWERVQQQYVDFLRNWRTDLGGKKNFHNGAGGNYDCIALMAYYVVCRDVTSLAEIEEMEGDLFLSAFRKMKFVDCNRPLFKKLLYRAFCNAKKQCEDVCGALR